jgi:hypothetical protein
MKRFVSTALTVALLLGLGILAMLARGGGALLPPTRTVPVALAAPQTAAAPDATIPGPKWNAIAIALNTTPAIPNAQALAEAITGTQRLLMWDKNAQAFDFYVPDPVVEGGWGNNFDLSVGMPVMVQVDSSAPGVFSMVGNVPPKTGETGAVQWTLVGGSPCKWNFISIPFDRSGVTTAQQLADAIGRGKVERLLVWDASANVQAFDFYVPDPIVADGWGNNFDVKIGYPYLVCLNTGTVWP